MTDKPAPPEPTIADALKTIDAIRTRLNDQIKQSQVYRRNTNERIKELRAELATLPRLAVKRQRKPKAVES